MSPLPRTIVRGLLAAAAVVLAARSAPAADPPTEPFTLLGAPDVWSSAYAVSGDGSTVVGTRFNAAGAFEAFAWTAAGGMVGLGDLGGGYSTANAVSFDGSVVVGEGFGADGKFYGFVWTAGTGMRPLPPLTEGGDCGAYGVSADGFTVVGYSFGRGGLESTVWTGDGRSAGLGVPSSFAYGVSAGGETVVGDRFGEFGRVAWVKRPGEESVDLDAIAPGGFSFAYAVSPDGSAVVGASQNENDEQEPTVWFADGSLVGMPTLAGYESSANAVSEGGELVVGQASLADGNRAFVWDRDAGARLLQDELVSEFGVDLAGWTLTDAQGVSHSGRVVTGNAVDAAGNFRAWVAVIGREQTPEELVLDLLDELELLPGGVSKPFVSKLTSVLEALDAGNTREALNRLKTFVNSVRAQRGKKISAAAADELIEAAEEVAASLRSV